MDSIEKQIHAILDQHPGVELAFLFGSCAKGRQTNRSDLDLAIATAQPFSLQFKMNVSDALAEVFGRPIDLIDLEHAGPTLLKEALVNGKQIVCRNIDLKVKFVLRLWEMEADFMPAFRKAQRERLEVFSHG